MAETVARFPGTVWLAPQWPKAKAAAVRDGILRVEQGAGWSPVPVAGAWRSFADMDPSNPGQVEAAARRYGPATREGRGVGEPLEWWGALVTDLRAAGQAWTDQGEVAGPDHVEPARIAASRIAERLARRFHTEGGMLEPSLSGLSFQPRALDLDMLLRAQAVHDVATLPPMGRCAFCGAWFSVQGRRSGVMYCSNSHRSAATQKRTPPVRFWEA
jgi:hypothetical protein